MNKQITELRLEDLKAVSGGKDNEIVFSDSEGMVIVAGGGGGGSKQAPKPAPKGGKKK